MSAAAPVTWSSQLFDASLVRRLTGRTNRRDRRLLWQRSARPFRAAQSEHGGAIQLPEGHVAINVTSNNRELVGEFVYVYRRGKKGIYTADYWFNGEHSRKSLKTRDRKTARKRGAALERKLTDGSLDTSKAAQRKTTGETLLQAIENFLSYHATESRSETTLKKYRGVLKKQLVMFASKSGVVLLAELDRTFVDKFREFRKPNIGVRSMNFEGWLLKSFFAWCVERELMERNPLERRKFPRVRTEPRGGPSLEEINSILQAASREDFPVLATLAFTGARSGECQRLRPEDVDLKNGWIRIVSRKGAETKTRLSRKVPIHLRLRGILATVPRHARDWFFVTAPSGGYPNAARRINTKKLNDDFKRLLHRLGLPTGRDGGYTIHSLRHSFETITVNANTPQRVVDSWMGHASDRSMAAVYYSLSDADSKKFMEMVPFGTGEPAADAGTQETKK